MITSDDLNWWLETAAGLDWIWAKTYADTAPHHYVAESRTPGMSHDDYVRAGRVIHTFGRPAKFYGMTSIYLTSPDGRLKWWTMDSDVRRTGLINRATPDRLYGVQNAPATESGIQTPYDAVASHYDEQFPSSDRFVSDLREAVDSLRSEHPTSVLDVGCGTGRVLDIGLTTPDRYAGVDPSKPMLNQLVRKHPSVAAVYPATIEKLLSEATFTPGQFEVITVLMNENDRFDELESLRTIASRGVVAAHGTRVKILQSARA